MQGELKFPIIFVKVRVTFAMTTAAAAYQWYIYGINNHYKGQIKAKYGHKVATYNDLASTVEVNTLKYKGCLVLLVKHKD